MGTIGANKKYYWLKLPENFFRSKAMKSLRRNAGGDTYTIIYLKMLLATLKTDGYLIFEGLEDNLIDEIAVEIDEESINVRNTLGFLEKAGLIEVSDDKQVLLNQLPTMIGSETSSAQKMRNKRKRDNELLTYKRSQCDRNVTIGYSQSDTEIEKESELKTEIEKESEIEIDDIYIYPSLDELIDICKDFYPHVNARYFHEYYTKNNWYSGKMKIEKDIRLTTVLQQWEDRNK